MANEELGEFFFSVYDKSKRETNQLLLDFFFYKHISLHGWFFFFEIYKSVWFRNVTRNAKDVHRCQVNVRLRRYLFFLPPPPFLLHLESKLFYFLSSCLSRRFTEGHGGTLTDWQHGSLQMSTCMITSFKSKTFMDLFRRDSTWLVGR